jgi:hypothetical protein
VDLAKLRMVGLDGLVASWMMGYIENLRRRCGAVGWRNSMNFA